MVWDFKDGSIEEGGKLFLLPSLPLPGTRTCLKLQQPSWIEVDLEDGSHLLKMVEQEDRRR